MVDIGNGIYCGSVGLIRVPYNHIKKQGWRDGLVHGIPMALFGVLAKPIVGALDAATHAGHNFLHFFFFAFFACCIYFILLLFYFIF